MSAACSAVSSEPGKAYKDAVSRVSIPLSPWAQFNVMVAKPQAQLNSAELLQGSELPILGTFPRHDPP